MKVTIKDDLMQRIATEEAWDEIGMILFHHMLFQFQRKVDNSHWLGLPRTLPNRCDHEL